MQEKVSVIEIDFINDLIMVNPDVLSNLVVVSKNKSLRLDETLKERFLTDVVDPFWHSEKDRLDFFQYFSTGQFFAQRKKLAYDFSNNTSYWKTYQFVGASAEQARQLKDRVVEFYEASIEVKQLKVRKKIEAINQEVIYFEARYMKAKRQRNELLINSDWRVLPDVEDSFPGEKDMWVAWRSYIRSKVIKSPSEFDTPLEFFKYTYENMLYPVDPNIYRGLYPDGLQEDGSPAPEYLDENDINQWVRHDIEASSDFYKNREQSIYNLSGQYELSRIKVRQEVLDIMHILNVEDVVPVDWDKYYVDDSELYG